MSSGTLTGVTSLTEIFVPATPGYFNDDLIQFLISLARLVAPPDSTPPDRYQEDDFSDFLGALGIRGLTPQMLAWTAVKMQESHRKLDPDVPVESNDAP